MRTSLAVLLAVALLAACGGDSTGPQQVDSIDDLAGTWSVTTWEYSLATDTTQKTDWVATQALNGTLHIQSSGDFASLIEFPWGFGRDYGEMRVEDGTIYWNGQNDEEFVPFQLVGDVLTARWPEQEFVDVDRDGQPEDAWLRMVFRRISAPAIDEVAGAYSATTFTVRNGGTTDVLAGGGSIDLVLNADGTTTGRLFVPDLFGPGTGIDADLAGSWHFYGPRLELNHAADTFLRDMIFSVGSGRFSGEEEFSGVTITVVFDK
ncbi:MAG: hypothetical protein GWN99_19775 [Gemmatimonadetes bacterium]|uniref:Lipocalin-like domain-containing protein n=1 Tax=Candidatus Kutchimonas denitrificans TaxID=3056748 RepID=A0AAE4Z9W0_9BACT|nr:hypothetical protein [Gemmatimonadota bacterium]NIR76445.1 hypothetical protein [Candidatus Kutchimonas denitrificans]NIS03263.1 hypothetical protein [Gemmatimonadota bacterium]NIT69124.1 hypothetical protein [Gemmatimonadota bacterium]NIU54516.1 hypothetical protein [Gemmatimonadota bacterium]